MNLLLDTHVFLWFISSDARLHPTFKAAIEDPQNVIFLSVVSVWEATIKQNTGKLPLPEAASVYMAGFRARHEIEALPLKEDDVAFLVGLRLLHRDPFDRMLVAQALCHGLTIITDDASMLQYPAQFLRR